MLKLGPREKRWIDSNTPENYPGAYNTQLQSQQQQHQFIPTPQKKTGILAVLPVSKGFLKKVTTLIDTEESRSKFFEALRHYHQSRDVKRLIRDLKQVLNTERKTCLFKDVRALIPEEQLHVYDRLVKLNKRGERLVRIKKRNNEPMGFTVRGGKEHGIGFFVTSVIKGSAACQAGLKVADEIKKVNGLPLFEAIHDEVISILRNDRVLNLLVRNSGIVPLLKLNSKIKWTEVEHLEEHRENEVKCEARDAVAEPQIEGDRYMSLTVTEQDGLGCSIDTHVNGHRGVYIVSIENGSLAERAGLRVGDQLLNVCGKDFGDVTYQEALECLQSNSTLILIVRYNKTVAYSLLGDEAPRCGNIKPILVKDSRSEKHNVDHSDEDERLHNKSNNGDDVIYAPEGNNFGYPSQLLDGRNVCMIEIEKDGALGMKLECKNEKIVVHQVMKGGSVEKHGFIRDDDWIMSCEGYDMVGMPLSEAQVVISMVMQRWSKFIEFIIAVPPNRPVPDLPKKSNRQHRRKGKAHTRNGKEKDESSKLNEGKSKSSSTEKTEEPLSFDPSEITLSSEVDNDPDNDVSKEQLETLQEKARCRDPNLPPPSLDIFTNPNFTNSMSKNTFAKPTSVSCPDLSTECTIEEEETEENPELEERGNNASGSGDEDPNGASGSSPDAKSHKKSLAAFFAKHTGKGKSSSLKEKFRFLRGKKYRKEVLNPSTPTKEKALSVDTIDYDGYSYVQNTPKGSRYVAPANVPSQYKSDLLLMITEDNPFEKTIYEEKSNPENVKETNEIEEADEIAAVEEAMKDVLKLDSSCEMLDDTLDDSKTEPPVSLHVLTDPADVRCSSTDDNFEYEINNIERSDAHSLRIRDDITVIKAPQISPRGIKGNIEEWEMRSGPSDHSSSEDCATKQKPIHRSDSSQRSTSPDFATNQKPIHRSDSSQRSASPEDAITKWKETRQHETCNGNISSDDAMVNWKSNNNVSTMSSSSHSDALDADNTSTTAETVIDINNRGKDVKDSCSMSEPEEANDRRRTSSQSDESNDKRRKGSRSSQSDSTSKLGESNLSPGSEDRAKKSSMSSSSSGDRSKRSSASDLSEKVENKCTMGGDPSEEVNDLKHSPTSPRNDNIVDDDSNAIRRMSSLSGQSDNTTSDKEVDCIARQLSNEMSPEKSSNDEREGASSDDEDDDDEEEEDDDTVVDSSDNSDPNEKINFGQPFSYMTPSFPVTSPNTEFNFSLIKEKKLMNDNELNSKIKSTSSDDSISRASLKTLTTINSYKDLSNDTPTKKKKSPIKHPRRNIPPITKQYSDSSTSSISPDTKTTIIKQSSVSPTVQKQMAGISVEASIVSKKMQEPEETENADNAQPNQKSLNIVSKKYFPEEEAAVFEHLKKKPNVFLESADLRYPSEETRNASDFLRNSSADLRSSSMDDEEKEKRFTREKEAKFHEERPFKPITYSENKELQSFRTIGDLKSIFNDPTSPTPMPKEVIKRNSGRNIVHEPVREISGCNTFTPGRQAGMDAKDNHDSNVKLRSCRDVGVRCGRNEPDAIFEPACERYRTSQPLSHEQVLRMTKKDIITDLISDSSSNPSPRSPTGIEVKSILLRNRKNSPKKVKFNTKVKVGMAYYSNDEEAYSDSAMLPHTLRHTKPSPASTIHEDENVVFSDSAILPNKIRSLGEKGMHVQPSNVQPSSTTGSSSSSSSQNNNVNRLFSKQRYFTECNMDTTNGEPFQFKRKLNDSSAAMRQSAESLGIDYVGKDASAFFKISNLDE